MATTLCALSLVSRRWTSSAVRALWHDPSRVLSMRHYPQPAGALLHLLLTRPLRTPHVKSLSRLSIHYDIDPVAYAHPDEDRKAEHWLLTILASCKNLETLALPGETPVACYEGFEPFKGIRHLILSLDRNSWPGSTAERFRTIDLEALQSLTEITLCDIDFDSLPPLPDCFFRLTIQRLNLVTAIFSLPDSLSDFFERWSSSSLRFVTIEVSSDAVEHLNDIPLSVETLILRERAHHSPPDLDGRDEEGSPWAPARPFHPLALQPRGALTFLEVPSIQLQLHDMRLLAEAFPNLRHLDLSDATWWVWEWVFPSFVKAFRTFATFIRAVPSLHFLSLGYLPLFPTYYDEQDSDHGATYTCFLAVVDERGLDLRYQFPLGWTRPDDKGSSEQHEREEYDEPDASRSSGYDDEVDEWEEEWGQEWRWIPFFGLFERSAVRTPPSSPSPPSYFRLADEQVYVDEPPVEARCSEVEDDEIEEDKEEPDEPWRRWETDEDVVEADRRWEAFEPSSD
ncbi:hypothetical protein JCM6882_009569 [Rhodosporidiobolus microsporus]